MVAGWLMMLQVLQVIERQLMLQVDACDSILVDDQHIVDSIQLASAWPRAIEIHLC